MRNLQVAIQRQLIRLSLVLGLALPTLVTAAPQRIVSLSPHLTEAVFWLGAESRLVGRDRFSNYPPAVKNIPVVGDAYSLNLEALAALNPDLILLWQPPQSLKTQLANLQLPVFDTNPTTVEAVYAELKKLATRLALPAQSQLAALRADIKQLDNYRLANTTNGEEKKALILVQQQPPIALGLGDPLAASLHYCGWRNSLKQPNAVVNLNPEFLWVGDYEVLIDFTGQTKPFRDVPLLQPEVDPLVRPGPRLPAALNQLCQDLTSYK